MRRCSGLGSSSGRGRALGRAGRMLGYVRLVREAVAGFLWRFLAHVPAFFRATVGLSEICLFKENDL